MQAFTEALAGGEMDEPAAKAKLAAAFDDFSMERLVRDVKQAITDGQPRALRVAAARKVVRSAAAAHDGFVTRAPAPVRARGHRPHHRCWSP